MLVTAKLNTIKYVAVFFSATGVFPLGPVFLAWALNNAAGPSIRAVTGGYVVALGGGGAVLATWRPTSQIIIVGTTLIPARSVLHSCWQLREFCTPSGRMKSGKEGRWMGD